MTDYKTEILKDIVADQFHTKSIGCDCCPTLKCDLCESEEQDNILLEGETAKYQGKRLCRTCGLKDISREDMREANKQAKEQAVKMMREFNQAKTINPSVKMGWRSGEFRVLADCWACGDTWRCDWVSPFEEADFPKEYMMCRFCKEKKWWLKN